MTAVADLKPAHRATWAAGDYAAVAELIDEAPPCDLLAQMDLSPGLKGLDVATGTGNVAIRAVGRWRAGRRTRPHPRAVRDRPPACGAHDVTVDWVEGDADQLLRPTTARRSRRASASASSRWEGCRAEIVAMAERRNDTTDGSLLMNAEYLVAVGRHAR